MIGHRPMPRVEMEESRWPECVHFGRSSPGAEILQTLSEESISPIDPNNIERECSTVGALLLVRAIGVSCLHTGGCCNMPTESLLYERSDFEALVETVAANGPSRR